MQSCGQCIDDISVKLMFVAVGPQPWLFDWPIDPNTGVEAVNEDLINASGKMLLLNKLLTELFAKGHKVLIFSQCWSN